MPSSPPAQLAGRAPRHQRESSHFHVPAANPYFSSPGGARRHGCLRGGVREGVLIYQGRPTEPAATISSSARICPSVASERTRASSTRRTTSATSAPLNPLVALAGPS